MNSQTEQQIRVVEIGISDLHEAMLCLSGIAFECLVDALLKRRFLFIFPVYGNEQAKKIAIDILMGSTRTNIKLPDSVKCYLELRGAYEFASDYLRFLRGLGESPDPNSIESKNFAKFLQTYSRMKRQN